MKYGVNTKVQAVAYGVKFTGTITKTGNTYFTVLPDEGQYFSDPAERREISIPTTRSMRYDSKNRMIRPL